MADGRDAIWKGTRLFAAIASCGRTRKLDGQRLLRLIGLEHELVRLLAAGQRDRKRSQRLPLESIRGAHPDLDRAGRRSLDSAT